MHLSTHIKAWNEMLKLHWQHLNCFRYYGGAGLDMFGFNLHNEKTEELVSDFCFDATAEEQSKEIPMTQLTRVIHRAVPRGIEAGYRRYPKLAPGSCVKNLEYKNNREVYRERYVADILSPLDSAEV